MTRTIALYALALGLSAWLLQWVEYRYLARAFPYEIYLALVALGFVALGIWLGRRLTPAATSSTFVRNEAAVRSLGLTRREQELLDRLSSGQSVKQLARSLGISPNTVKSHLARLYAKLGVNNRIEAIEKARGLSLIS